MFWPVWRLPDRAAAVVVAADPDRGMTVGRPRGPAAGGQWDNTAPACGAVPAGQDVADSADRKRCAPTTTAAAWDAAEVGVLAPAGGRECLTVEVRHLASGQDAGLAAAADTG